MDYLDSVLLLGIDRMNGERTTAGLFHLLNGKKSSQTVQDGRLFNLSHLFSTIRGFKFSEFHKKVETFQHNGWVKMNDENHAEITDSGTVVLQNRLKNHPIPSCLDGWQYGDLSRLFWHRLTLYVQSLSFILHGDYTFHPIQNDPDVQSWVKQWFPRGEHSLTLEAEAIYKELVALLRMIDDQYAENLVLRLTRLNRVGKTNMQVAEEFQMDPLECHFHFQATIHFLLDNIRKHSGSYPTLNKFCSDKEQPFTLTESTRKTYQMINNGLTLEEVATVRQLKISTIEDHFVELAIYVPNMDISQYILKHDQKKIIHASKKLDTKRLKVIKQELGETVTYFQIRLTLAKYADGIRSTKGVMSIVD